MSVSEVQINGLRRAATQRMPSRAKVTRNWYVAHTLPHAEAKAARHLREQGFNVYVPVTSKQRRHSRRIETVSVPLFPRYLFVSFDINIHRWRSINSTTGIDHLVGNGDAPTPVSDGIVEELKNSEDANGYVNPGLRATFAAFAELLGDMTDRERIALLLKVLDRSDGNLIAA